MNRGLSARGRPSSSQMTAKSRDLPVAIAAVLPGKLDDVGRQPLLILAALRHLALCRAVLAERRAGATLGDAKLTANMLDTGAATRRAQ
jgi:hypothetical protein